MTRLSGLLGVCRLFGADLFVLSFSRGFPQESCSYGPAPSKLLLRLEDLSLSLFF